MGYGGLIQGPFNLWFSNPWMAWIYDKSVGKYAVPPMDATRISQEAMINGQ